EFCHAEAQQLQQKPTNAENIQWVLVSYAAQDSLNKFAETYDLYSMSGLFVLMDKEMTLYEHLQVKSIPTSYIYNRHHNLVTVKQGAAKLENLIQLTKR
ncbi:MAG: hypothetical protein LBV47_07895, partial [Bacteroidales bacterium]|nr:hypothetical protein [Bacteroidales bacterium]